MKRLRDESIQTAALVGPASVALALAIWGGLRVWQSAAAGADTQLWLALVLGANLFLSLWVWYRAQPSGSWGGLLPSVSLLMAAMLLEELPQVLWPADESVHLAGSIAGSVVIGAVIVMQVRRIVIEIRRRRSLTRGATAL
jgi:hypothetical protein